MGMYDNYDMDQANKVGMVFVIFMVVLCLILVCANLFAGAAIAWKWVFAPIWGPMALGFVLTLLGVRPPGQ
jgi:uncharacterized protein (DUF983 family)